MIAVRLLVVAGCFFAAGFCVADFFLMIRSGQVVAAHAAGGFCVSVSVSASVWIVGRGNDRALSRLWLAVLAFVAFSSLSG